VIRGSADLLRRGGLSEEKRARYLEAIIETADRASSLTSHLLAFGRRQPLKPVVIDINLRLDALAEILSRTLGGQIEVKLDLAPDLWPSEVDSAQLETALLNAAINARDAMPDGGTLTISTHNVSDKAGDMICIALADTGTGMPEEIASRAFEPFFTTKEVGKGTGLGLSQIHGFAAQTGGRAEIKSAPGKGTIVRIFLPRSTKTAANTIEREHEFVSGEGMTILLVEDNEHVREFAHNLLVDLQYRVCSAENGDEALDLLEREKVDLLFSDIVMPGYSGVELARLVRERFPRMPVLLASGYSEEIVEGAALEFEVLTKPYGADTLAAALAAASERAGALAVA
jgi:CheY-like chemotaxis protein